jgi:hypothetical protein
MNKEIVMFDYYKELEKARTEFGEDLVDEALVDWLENYGLNGMDALREDEYLFEDFIDCLKERKKFADS